MNSLNNQPILRSKRLILRPFNGKDAEDVFEFASNAEVTKYLTWYPHTQLSQSEQVIQELYMMHEGTFAIELVSENKCIGCIDLRVDQDHEKASFGYVLNQQYWNKGYMSEALMLILEFAFEKLHLNRVEATHYRNNEASGQVMKKCGMSYEGTGIEEQKIKGVYVDVLHYAIVKKDWIKQQAINKQEN